uniref:Centrosomal protein of 104 kDa n=1 Tax=Monopterus albus TaxID=43700 RepID=A0A3Q3QHB0_MONAL
MPRKIGFTVVSSSSHEDNFSAKELMVHAPTVSGWRSSRLCSYPQHITFQLVERSRVRKLQLLAHQYLIPAKVEFHIGDTLPETSNSGFPGQLRRLGYVALSDNEKTGFKARELKSVHVDAIGTYLRITFHRNHVNSYNHYNQVALVAINVLGDSLDGNTFNTIVSGDVGLKCESIAPLDDLAFDMYQDPEVAHIIRLLDQKKQDMVQQEKYEQVKNLKQAIADLQKVGERLARYDVEKQCAIEKEDYDLAKKKKELMEDYRRSVYQQLEVHNLLDMTTPRVLPLYCLLHSCLQFPPSLLCPQTQWGRGRKPVITKSQIKCESCIMYVSLCCVVLLQVTSVPYDERPLPALQRKEQSVEVIQSPAEGDSLQPDTHGSLPSAERSGEPEPLTEKTQKEAGLPIDVYGESLVAGAYSKIWSYREDALLAVYKRLLVVSPTIPKEELRNMIRAAVFLVKKALLDKASSVFQTSLKLLRLLLSQSIPGLGLGRAELSHCLEQTWPNLLARTGESASRLRAPAITFIEEIAVLKEVRALQVIPSELVKPFRSNFPARLAQSRAELLEKLLSKLGTESSGFTLDNVMMFCTAAMEHSSPSVRELAVRIILSMYQQHRSAVLNYLPSTENKNFLYRTLFDGFAKIDGKVVETQQEGQKEKDEIHSLQEQLAALREITVGGAVFVLCILGVYLSYLPTLFFFCGKKDESFTEDGLDLHYWKHCPMLRRCDECRQVVEIASLTEHLLSECENRSKFSQCPCCSEAVTTEELAHHVQGPACNPTLFLFQAWKTHLMGREGCKQNSRRTVVSQRIQQSQGKAFIHPLLTPTVPPWRSV